jgi:hypothetical protein
MQSCFTGDAKDELFGGRSRIACPELATSLLLFSAILINAAREIISV